MTSLTAPERETVINTCDADEHIQIWTAQRPIITKLRKNPSATLVEWGKHGTTVWASFTMPDVSEHEVEMRAALADAVGRAMTDDERAVAADRMRTLNASA